MLISNYRNILRIASDTLNNNRATLRILRDDLWIIVPASIDNGVEASAFPLQKTTGSALLVNTRAPQVFGSAILINTCAPLRIAGIILIRSRANFWHTSRTLRMTLSIIDVIL